MDLEQLYRNCAKEQVRNFYKLQEETFKSLAMDLEDVEQEIKLLIWQTIEDNKGKIFDKGLENYIGGMVSNHLRDYVIHAINNNEGVTLSDFSLPGISQTNEEILSSVYDLFKLYAPKKADLWYAILYKKLYIGKTEPQIAEDLVKEGLVPSINVFKVKNIFWDRIVRDYRTKGKTFKNPTPSDKEKVTEEEPITDDSTNKESIQNSYSEGLVETPEIMFDDIRPLLTDRQYEIIEKVFKEGKSFQEIAHELSITKSTVSNNYYRSIEKLRKIIKNDVVQK